MQEMLEIVRVQVERLAALIEAPEAILPTYGTSRDLGYPHIEYIRPYFHYVVTERGEVLEARQTQDLDELLYWVFSDVTHALASAWEVRHRSPGTPSRHALPVRQLQLLEVVSPDWCNSGAVNENGHRVILASLE